MSNHEFTDLILVPQKFLPYIPAVILRLQTLYPKHSFRGSKGVIQLSADHGDDVTALRQDAAHLLYKEKIYEETLPLRKSILKGLFE